MKFSYKPLFVAVFIHIIGMLLSLIPIYHQHGSIDWTVYFMTCQDQIIPMLPWYFIYLLWSNLEDFMNKTALAEDYKTGLEDFMNSVVLVVKNKKIDLEDKI